MSDSRSQTLGLVVAVSVAVSVVMIAQQVAGKAVRDAYFLSVYAAEVLARVMTVSSILSVIAVLGVSRLYGRFSPARMMPLFFVLGAAFFAAEWTLIAVGAGKLAALILYVHTASFGAVAISGFWAVMNERYDPHTAKRVIGRVASGATVGGVLGGVAAWQGAASVSISTMLLILSAANALCAVGIAAVGRGSPRAGPGAASDEPQTRQAPWQLFEDSPYLRNVALLVILIAFGTAGVDYVFKATAAASFSDSQALVSFFALFYLATGVAAFVVQNGLASWLLRRAGLAAAVASLPLVLLLFGPVALLFPGLFSMALLRGSASTAESSSYRSGYELLYTPLAPETKRPAKTLVDVGGDKLGAALGSAVAVFLVGLIPGHAPTLLIAGAVGCALVALAISRRLARGYVDALAESLASGRVDRGVLAEIDPSSRRAVEATIARIDTGALGTLRRAAPRPAAAVEAADNEVEFASPDAVLDAAAVLAGPDPAALDAALRAQNPLPRSWASALIALLARPELEPLVSRALTHNAPAHIDALLDPGLPQQVAAKNRSVRVDRDAVIAAAATELRLARARRPGPLDLEPGSGEARELGRRLAFALALLATVLPAGELQLAVAALSGGDARQRGTGLEYLDNVLPESLRSVAIELLGCRPVTSAAERVSGVPAPALSLADLRARLDARVERLPRAE